MGRIRKPNGFNPEEYVWRNNDCYAYATNLKRPMDYIGDISGYKNKAHFSKEELIERLVSDMEKENVYVYETNFEQEPSDWEWKIAVFSVETSRKEKYDYHFMREDSNGRWSHKFRGEKPTDKDLDGIKIVDPRLATINKRYEYIFIGFFMLCPLC